MTRRAVSTAGAPAAIGPYSQGIVADGFLFCAGQAALDPATGALVEGGIEPETERVMANLSAVLDAAGASWGDVVKTTIFLVDMADFATVNAHLRPVRHRSAAGALDGRRRGPAEGRPSRDRGRRRASVDTPDEPPLRCPDPLMTADCLAPGSDRSGRDARSDDRRPTARPLVNPPSPDVDRPARSPSCWRPASAPG